MSVKIDYTDYLTILRALTSFSEQVLRIITDDITLQEHRCHIIYLMNKKYYTAPQCYKKESDIPLIVRKNYDYVVMYHNKTGNIIRDCFNTGNINIKNELERRKNDLKKCIDLV